MLFLSLTCIMLVLLFLQIIISWQKPQTSMRRHKIVCKISITEVSLTRMLGSLCIANVFNSQSVVMFSYPYIL